MKSPTLVVLDIPFLYFSIHTSKKSKLNYEKYFARLKDQDADFEPLNLDIRLAVGYCNQSKEHNPNFRTMLHAQGLDLKQNRHAHSYHLVLETLELCPNVETVVIGSTSSYIGMLTQGLKKKGKRVIIFSYEVPEWFERTCKVIQIPDSYLIASE